MVIGAITQGFTRGVEGVADRLVSPFTDPVIRLGVTGLSRAGKTVFITSLVANLMDRGRMPQFAAGPRIQGAVLRPQPDDTVARFDYEGHMAQLMGPEPSWPEGTRRVSELRLSLRVQQGGLLAGVQGPRTVHLDIVDYPGEWLLDLGLLEKDYAQWTREALGRAERRAAAMPQAAALLAAVTAAEAEAQFEEPRAKALARAFTEYLNAAREAGYSDCTPGRFLLPGDLEGSPVLTFAPLPGTPGGKGSLKREMERRYEAYKREVVKPFFRDHFARIDRQVVLVDVLSAIHAGPQAVEDLRAAMADILRAFRPGRNAFLSRIFQGRRIDRILFAATKADHLHHSEHAKLAAITEALLRDARDRADFAGAKTQAMAIAALRTTVEDRISHGGEMIDMVRGKLLETGRQAALHAGALPDDPSQLLAPARAGAERWLDGDYSVMNFAPARMVLKPGEGPPHIRLDRAAEFLLGDRL
ncbi:YcjX family protein [Limimaricola soesokkakensis]|uniref:YcjX family protein n=1 Tax=Limimaricola soesokkakensis TaxID=1343159 RepID=UPI0035169103